ncbi:Uncharacterised protein [Salmonella enterica subsp. arizonae]|uniref:Uncharacterized protein n=1 Tax=Salmonella enterica subsp. arizonae TaxID=59203 RepID=A0A2X4TIG5_SALER|nr:Uncharacterised protein [Salmonella enterica subsp. arizonae]
MNFLTEVVHLLFSQTAFQERASVYARRDVALEVHQVAAILFVARTEEMVETDIIDRGGRLEGRHVAANSRSFLDARSTVMMAFQRIAERIRRSSSRLPGIPVRLQRQ